MFVQSVNSKYTMRPLQDSRLITVKDFQCPRSRKLGNAYISVVIGLCITKKHAGAESSCHQKSLR